jgi:hypothetical protein
MLHKNRRWTLAEVETAGLLARTLVEHTWCVCNGFYVAGRPDVVFLNDSTGPDGAQEYAVCRKEDGNWYQIESITFGWCKLDRAEQYVRGMLGAAPAAMRAPVNPRIETREEHGRHGRPMCCA